jgi:hypothetical protein
MKYILCIFMMSFALCAEETTETNEVVMEGHTGEVEEPFTSPFPIHHTLGVKVGWPYYVSAHYSGIYQFKPKEGISWVVEPGIQGTRVGVGYAWVHPLMQDFNIEVAPTLSYYRSTSSSHGFDNGDDYLGVEMHVNSGGLIGSFGLYYGESELLPMIGIGVDLWPYIAR